MAFGKTQTLGLHAVLPALSLSTRSSTTHASPLPGNCLTIIGAIRQTTFSAADCAEGSKADDVVQLQALEWLLTAPGASRTVLEARVPYATAAVAEILGQAPASFASRAAAADLARAAYRHAPGHSGGTCCL